MRRKRKRRYIEEEGRSVWRHRGSACDAGDAADVSTLRTNHQGSGAPGGRARDTEIEQIER